jgi:mannose-6-phosphate isomerase-like protein (cupin superfamily)
MKRWFSSKFPANPTQEPRMKLVAKEMESALSDSGLLRRKLAALAAENKGKAQAFKMRARLLEQGRANIPVAATEDMSVMVKVYASGGENGLHAHPIEDHTFIILQGAATFYDEEGEMATLHANEGILVPKGSLYRFHSVESEGPLVMLRVGTPNMALHGKTGTRTNAKGEYMQGDSEENKTVEMKVLADAYFG